MSYINISRGSAGSPSEPVLISPATPVADNDMVLVVLTMQTGGGYALGTTVEGFTKVSEQFSSAGRDTVCQVFAKTIVDASAEPASYTINFAAGSHLWEWACLRFAERGAVNDILTQLTPVNVPDVFDVIPLDLQGLTTRTEDDLVWVAVAGYDSYDGNAATLPAGMTEVVGFEAGVFKQELIAVSDNVSAGNTGTLSGSVTLNAGTDGRGYGVVLALPALSPALVIRKNGTATFDKPAGIGTITGVTLNGNTIDLDSQTVDDFTVTDSDGTITTSGTYDLVATGDTVETISVQVNVVGLPTNTAKKDGGLLTSLADLTLDAVNSSGTVVEQLTGITTDASGIISAIDLSHISEAIGDTLKVSLHSAAADVGVTFEQALEAI